MRNSTLTCILLFSIWVSFAQNEPFFKSYSWDPQPEYSVDSNTENDIIALKDKTVSEFYFTDDSLIEYLLEHRVYWLNSDDKIEDYNKIYLPYSSSSFLEINRARVITKEGEVIELDESKILTAQDEETKSQYKYFAFEGIEKGSFIEYYYVVKRNPRYKGKRLTLQTSYPKKNIEFDLIAPKNLFFKFKSYNDLPEVKLDTTVTEKLHWKLRLDNLDELENEELSAYNASKKHIVYKLDRNLANGTKDISSYTNTSQNLYAYYYPEYDKKTEKQIRSFLETAIAGSDEDEVSKIRKLEYYIKSNVYVTDGSSDELQDLNQIINKKVANETGIIKLYIAFFRALKIKHEMVLTTDRRSIKFDKEFEANNFLNDFLIYFTKSKLYLSPTDSESRLGFSPSYLTDTYGLFIKEVKVGEFTSGIGKIKYIEPVSADKTVDEMIIDVNFNKDDLSIVNVKLKRAINGYYGMNIHPFMNLVKADDKKELIEGFAKNLDEDADIISADVVNEDPELFGIKPLEFNLDFNSEAFIEKAGPKYLFKIGELIGQQIQLYQEKERVLPLENGFKRSYFRTINVNIPEGYVITNLEDLNIKNTFSKEGKEVLIFNSYYTVDEQKVKVTADEHYRVNIIDTDFYEDYRTVINSAADFNKITLILELAK